MKPFSKITRSKPAASEYANATTLDAISSGVTIDRLLRRTSSPIGSTGGRCDKNIILLLALTPMDKPTVLIAGLLGSGCTASALELAKLTSLTIVNSESIIREIVSEKRVPYTLLIEMARDGEVDLEDLVRSIALDYVREGGVIIEGRTALMLLDRPALLKVFLYADKKVRVERVAKRRGLSLEEAEREIEESDEDRRRLVEKLFKRSFMDPSLYDLILNTTELSYEDVARLLNDLIRWKHTVATVAKK